MRRLYDYLKEPWVKIDGHFHGFNHKSSIEMVDGYGKAVTFMDLEYDKKNLNPAKSYNEFTKSSYNDEKHILLATGVTIEDIKSIYESHKEIIKGFGELKCYDEYKGEKVPYKKISFINQVCRFSKEVGCLPVYIHWGITNDKDLKHLRRTLTIYGDVPVVLCHCGMNDTNQSYAYTQVCQLMKDYRNLWVDLTYTAAEFFSENIMLLDALDKSRIILGTDINNKIFGKTHNVGEEISSIKSQISIIENYIGFGRSEGNILKLFSLI